MANSQDFPRPTPGAVYIHAYYQGEARADRKEWKESWISAALVILENRGEGVSVCDDAFGIISTQPTGKLSYLQ